MMKVFKCCCGWTYVVGKRQVYGPVKVGMGESPSHLMTQKEFYNNYADCRACAMGCHHHPTDVLKKETK